MKKFSFVALLLAFTVLLASCSDAVNGFDKVQKETGNIAFSISDTDVAKMVSKIDVKKARTVFGDEAVGTESPVEEYVPTDFDKDMGKFAIEVVVKGSNDYYESQTIDLSEEEIHAILNKYDMSDEHKTDVKKYPVTFEKLPIAETYTVYVIVNYYGYTCVYGKSATVELVPNESVPVTVSASWIPSDDYAAAPKVTVTGNFDDKPGHDYYFAVLESDYQTKNVVYYGFDAYPVDVTLTFKTKGGSTIAKQYDAKMAYVNSFEKDESGNCSVTFTFNEDDTGFVFAAAGRNGSTQKVSTTIVEVANNVSMSKDSFVDSSIAVFNCLDPKGIWLFNDVPDPSVDLSVSAPLTGTSSGEFSKFSFDHEGQIWYVAEGNKVFRNGKDTGFANAFPSYTPVLASYDVVNQNLCVLTSGSKGIIAITLDVSNRNEENFTISESCKLNEINLSQKLKDVDLSGVTMSAFTVYEGKILIAFSDSKGVPYIGCILDADGTEYCSIKPTDNLKLLDGEKLIVKDLIVQDGIVYATLGSMGFADISLSGANATQRGCIASYIFKKDDFGDTELIVNPSFNKGKSFGWTSTASYSSTLLKYYAPASETAGLFGHSLFAGRRHGKLIVSDAGLYLNGKNDTKLIKHIIIYDIKTETAEYYDTCADLGLTSAISLDKYF